jgi:hypothetical protein
MTKDDIIKMAQKAGLVIDGNNSGDDDLLAFAHLVAAHKAEVITAEAYRCGVLAGAEAEREACAKECEHTSLRMGSEWMAAHCAAAIRARGNT